MSEHALLSLQTCKHEVTPRTPEHSIHKDSAVLSRKENDRRGSGMSNSKQGGKLLVFKGIDITRPFRRKVRVARKLPPPERG
jgi:hypothetical protein